MLVFCFFFSSRRRHTRCSRDWSSDVCSSDLLFAAFAGIYFWLPKWTGKMYDEKLWKIHFWLTMIFFNMIFFVQHFLGLAGMPRRIPDYPLMFETWNKISSIGAFGMGLSQLLFLYIVLKCIRNGPAAPAKPWEGADSL